MPPASRLAPLVALALAACAGQKQSWKSLGAELSIEVLPRNADVSLDGEPVGHGAGSRPIPEAGRRYRVRATAAGFEPREVEVDGSRLSGGQTVLVLRPVGFGSQRRLDATDPDALAQAAMTLLRAGRLDDASEYASRSLDLGNTALAHKVLGVVYARRGDRRQATLHYGEYLSLVPDAPDARQVEAEIARMRGDVAIPAAGGR